MNTDIFTNSEILVIKNWHSVIANLGRLSLVDSREILNMEADFMNLFDTAIENNADEILLNYIRKILPSLSAMADKIEKGKRDTVDFYEILLNLKSLLKGLIAHLEN
ncbi:MAG: hypothetical protein HOG49_32985 [Candidatus Scalindua sp.]|nr:hypothetical protein [Candidatus Scalindua sp.]